ncbi:MAG: putative toxin-antitoxin system toxin component, PIN family [Acidobacteria bacterium]|nr:putative toxin-antitoxin system toxin component, PIN family [Acidobacteriota bacterium]
MKRLRVVFDCMIFLQGAARKEGPAGVCLDLAQRGVIELCVSLEILGEVAGVLSRPSIRHRFPSLNDAVVAAFLAEIRHRAKFFKEVPRSMELARDPKDEAYLNLARHARVDYLVTRDADLLDLASSPGLGFEFVDPVDFLTQLRREM